MPAKIPRREVLAGLAVAGAASGLSSRTSGAKPPARATSLPDARAFAGDVRLPGLLHAVIARPPLPGWQLSDFNPSSTLGTSGVVDIVPLMPDGPTRLSRLGGVAVLARDRWSALRGLDRLQIAWKQGNPEPTEIGSFPPFHHHAASAFPSEIPCATADSGREVCAIWASLPPTLGSSEIACLFEISPMRIALAPIRPGPHGQPRDLGYVYDAVRISRMVGAPVSLAWTRLDDLPFIDHARQTVS